MDVGDDMDVSYQTNRTLRVSGSHSTAAGFTLAELLVTLLISGILLGMAVPTFSDLIQTQQLTGQINTMVADLNFARSEAIKRMRRVLLCKSTDQITCDPGAQWHDGWIVFADRDADNLKDPDEPRLRSQGPLPEGYTIEFGSFYTSRYVRYYPDGHAVNTGTFTFCDPRGADYARAIIIFRGRLRADRVNGSGDPLSCP